MENLDPVLAARVRTHYQESGMTQKQLAKKIGCGFSTLSLFLNSGKAGFSLRRRIITYLDKKGVK